jgi:uncharacterized protein YndB with AHSA1/START domain
MSALTTTSFEIHQEIELAAPPDRVFEALLDVNAWWSHHFKPPDGSDEVRLILEPRLGGAFRQEWGDGEGALFGVVTFLRRPEIIRLSGPLGMTGAIASVYEWRLGEIPRGRTKLALHHGASGLLDPDERDRHDRGWRKLMSNLARFVEHGAADSNKASGSH